jgi:hypothetical protein
MSESKVNVLKLLKKYEAIIKQFVMEEKGCVVVYTDDPIVVKALRNLFSTHFQFKGD